MCMQVKYQARYPCSKNKSENIGYKFAIFVIIIKNSAMCFILLNNKKIRLFFDVLFVRLPYSDPEILPFFLYDGGPLVSILKKHIQTRGGKRA